jgi:hypothetical protein
MRLVTLLVLAALANLPLFANAAEVSPRPEHSIELPVHMYSLSDIGKSGAPAIRSEDLKRLRQIIAPLAATLRAGIWWAYTRRQHNSRSFVVVYTEGANPNNNLNYFPVLTRGCNVVYSPYANLAIVQNQCFRFPLTVYRVNAAGKPGQPSLTPDQRAWLSRILRTPYFAQHVDRLQYVMLDLSKPNPYMEGPPLVVILEDTSDQGWVVIDHQATNEFCNPAYWYASSSLDLEQGCKKKQLPSPIR